MTEKQIEDLLKDLSKEQVMQFALSCIERTISLFKSSEECRGKLPKSKGYDAIASIVDFMKNDIHSVDKSKIKAQIRKCNNIMDYLIDLEDWNPIISIIESIVDSMTFYMKNSGDISCTYHNLEIIDQLKSDEYTNTINADASDKELDEYLEPFFEKELQTEYDAIEMIKNNATKDDLELFIQNNQLNIPIFI